MSAWALVLLILGGAPPDGGEDTTDPKVEAGRYLETGNAALESGDTAAALDAYRAAYDAFPSPKIFYNMAEAHREQGDLVEAANLYERVIVELPEDSPLVAASQDRLTELDARVGHLSVTTEPIGARVEMNGRELGVSPVAELRVPPGTIELRASLDGRSQLESVVVPAGEARSVSIDLVVVSAQPPPPPSVAVVEETTLVQKWWFWTAIGFGVVAAGTAVALVATSGDNFRPQGELPTTSLNDWPRR